MPSKLWKFFKKGFEVAICNRCRASIPTKRGNTAGLRSHLKFKHTKDDYLILIELEKCDTPVSDISVIGEPPLKQQKQSTIADGFNRQISNILTWDDSYEESIRIEKLIIRWIVQDYLSFKFVEGDGFREFMQAAYPKYRIKGRNFYATSMLDDLYSENKSHISNEIKKGRHISLTTDSWSDFIAKVSLVSLTAQYIDDDFNLKSFVLAARAVEESQTGAFLSDILLKELSDWSIPFDKIHLLLRDGASNIVLAATLSQLPDFWCSIHRLQNALKDSILKDSAISELIARKKHSL